MCTSEIVQKTMHNLYTLRGAKVDLGGVDIKGNRQILKDFLNSLINFNPSFNLITSN